MGAARSSSSGEVQAFSSTRRRSSSALLDKGFAALEREFEASRRFDSDKLEDSSEPSEESSPLNQLESPSLSPQHGSEFRPQTSDTKKCSSFRHTSLDSSLYFFAFPFSLHVGLARQQSMQLHEFCVPDIGFAWVGHLSM